MNTEPYEPSAQDIDFLNKVDKGYIGLTKPKVTFIKEESDLIPITVAIVEDGDRNPRIDVDQE